METSTYKHTNLYVQPLFRCEMNFPLKALKLVLSQNHSTKFCLFQIVKLFLIIIIIVIIMSL